MISISSRFPSLPCFTSGSNQDEAIYIIPFQTHYRWDFLGTVEGSDSRESMLSTRAADPSVPVYQWTTSDPSERKGMVHNNNTTTTL